MDISVRLASPPSQALFVPLFIHATIVTELVLHYTTNVLNTTVAELTYIDSSHDDTMLPYSHTLS